MCRYYLVPDDIDIPCFPEIVLQRWVFTRGLRPRHQVLIQWSNWPASLATWEDEVSLHQAFPFAPAWGQASAQQGGMLLASLTKRTLMAGRVGALEHGSPVLWLVVMNGVSKPVRPRAAWPM